MGFAQDGDYVDDILQVVRTDVNYEYAPDWNFHWAASYRQAEQNFDHFYFGNYCGLDGKTQRMRLVQKGYIDQIYYWQQTSNKTTTNTFDIKGKFKTGQLEHQIMVGTDWTYEQREPRLANKTQNGSAIYGYVNQSLVNEYSRGNGPLKISQHNYNEGTTYGVFIQDLIGLNDQLKLMMGLRYDYFDFSTTNKIKNEHRNVKTVLLAQMLAWYGNQFLNIAFIRLTLKASHRLVDKWVSIKLLEVLMSRKWIKSLNITSNMKLG